MIAPLYPLRSVSLQRKLNEGIQANYAGIEVITKLDEAYQVGPGTTEPSATVGFHACINLHVTVATRLMTIFYIVSRPWSSDKTPL